MTPDVWDFIDLAKFAVDGSWPVAGGVLDQADAFVRGVEVYKREVALHKAKYGIK